MKSLATFALLLCASPLTCVRASKMTAGSRTSALSLESRRKQRTQIGFRPRPTLFLVSMFSLSPALARGPRWHPRHLRMEAQPLSDPETTPLPYDLYTVATSRHRKQGVWQYLTCRVTNNPSWLRRLHISVELPGKYLFLLGSIRL